MNENAENTMVSHHETLQKDVEMIKDRNTRVESDKAWETSFTRHGLVAILTYIVVVLFMYIIDIADPLKNALIPTLGYLLSVQAVPMAKKLWINKYF